MSRRFFTADWHLCHPDIIEYAKRPFKDVSRMNEVLVKNCNQRAKEDDIVIHVGDFYCYNDDRGGNGLKINPNEFIKKINATFINIQGNHDPNNKVKSVATSLRTTLGKNITSVSVGHFPSYNPLAKGTFNKGDIHICGHVHEKWKYFIDKQNSVLNINVGVDVWNYNPVTEDELIAFINQIIANKK